MHLIVLCPFTGPLERTAKHAIIQAKVKGGNLDENVYRVDTHGHSPWYSAFGLLEGLP